MCGIEGGEEFVGQTNTEQERRLDCAFPCEKFTDEEMEVGYGSAANGGRQEVVRME